MVENEVLSTTFAELFKEIQGHCHFPPHMCGVVSQPVQWTCVCVCLRVCVCVTGPGPEPLC